VVTGRLVDSRRAILAGVPLAVGLGLAAGSHPFAALVGAGAVLLALLVLLRAEAVLLVLVAALPWEGALAYPTEEVSAVKVLGVLLFAAWLVRALVQPTPLRVSPALGWAGLLGLAVALSLLFAPDPAESVLAALRYALFIIFFFLVLQLTTTAEQVRRILRVMVISTAAAAAWGLYNFLVVGLDRAGGPIEDPNDFAYLMICVLPLAVFLLVSERRRRLLWTVCCLLLLGATFATLSRGALVGLAALAPWAVVTRRLPVKGVLLGFAIVVSVGALAFIALAPMLHDRLEAKSRIADKNVTARQALWSAALRMWEDRPAIGVGPGRFGIEAPAYVRNNPLIIDRPVVHNSYLHVLAELGALGLLAFVGMLGSSWLLLGRARRRAREALDPDGSRMATAMEASLVVAIAGGAFLSEQLTTPFWLIGALAAVVGSVPRAVRAPVVGVPRPSAAVA
jgi:O-antigen ligase